MTQSKQMFSSVHALAGLTWHERRAATLTPVSKQTLEKLGMVHQLLLTVDDVPIATDHVLHGGIYSRTIRLQPAVAMLGSLVQRPTILIVQGSTLMLSGDDEQTELEGYTVLPGSAGRKQLFVTRSHVVMTMLYATKATTIEQAENEVFAEADLLISRKDDSRDTITITGE